MRNFLLTSSIMVGLAGPVYAYTEDEKAEICPTLGSMSAQIMKNRQEGVPLSKALSVVPSGDDDAAQLIRSIVMAAYSEPQHFTDDMIKHAVDDFRNQIEIRCYD